MSDQKNSLGMDQKTASWFAYFPPVIGAIILLVVESKENRTVRTHAWQGLIMGCFFVAVYIVIGILAAILWWGFLWWLFILLYNLTWIAWVALTIICIVKAIQGDMFKVPVIYDKVKDLN